MKRITKSHIKTIRKRRILQYPEYKKGDKIFFTYRCWESEQSQDAELWHHTKQFAVVLKKLPKTKVDEHSLGVQMYIVRFKDGFEYEVTSEEMQPLTRKGKYYEVS